MFSADGSSERSCTFTPNLLPKEALSNVNSTWLYERFFLPSLYALRSCVFLSENSQVEPSETDRQLFCRAGIQSGGVVFGGRARADREAEGGETVR
jgi:hypothetical protein